MSRFCFGVMLQVLQLCSPKKTTQKYLCGTMLQSVNEKYNITSEDQTAGHLKDCSRELSRDVTDFIGTADYDVIQSCFEEKIIPFLLPDKQKQAALALIYILINDETIGDDIRIGTLTENCKGDYREMDKTVFSLLLADLFIFAVKAIKNSVGAEFVKSVTKQFISQFDQKVDTLTFLPRQSRSLASLPLTVDSKNFSHAFEEISTAKMGLPNPEDVRIFRLKSEDYEFPDTRLKKYLTDNIGRYLYSRRRLDRFHREGDDFSVGLEAAMYLREHPTGNVLGEIMVYSFLEEILKAPKILSKVELSSDLGQSDGIHLRVEDGAAISQLVYGASNIQGGLKAAVDIALDRIVEIRKTTPDSFQLVESAAFSMSMPGDQMVETVRRIIFPVKKNVQPPATAFGVFLGYTLELDENVYNLPLQEFKERMAGKLREDIAECAEYIFNGLKKRHLTQHSFYIYVLPLNDADKDRDGIIRKLIGGPA